MLLVGVGSNMGSVGAVIRRALFRPDNAWFYSARVPVCTPAGNSSDGPAVRLSIFDEQLHNHPTSARRPVKAAHSAHAAVPNSAMS
jgi:hypothetical protein